MVNINELLLNNNVISDDKFTAETFNEYFITVKWKMAAEFGNQSSYLWDDSVTCTRDHYCPEEFLHFSDITTNNVALRLKKLNVSKV